ncbi:MAG TPA: prolyl oligopeptidase family serine peptidase [Nocardioides sp.]|uniref:prolyl oligopeptidase family serine peptidase n=1 Tax=Nocardioides sp. TaxID=35761 RepID=UPI002E36A202|nr:prolyl oligopeptidase family serine peptidase [Nocardioides sp.]HEX3931555.1 prolyl oligopeptidase family serine peptidase [Nocardioides sp.]
MPNPPLAPPTAQRRPFTHSEHDVTRPDPYHWLGGDDPAVIAHLVAERAFYDASTVHLGSLGSTLKAEMLARLPSDDESARWDRSRFTYWTRHPVNSDYAELWRLNHDSEAGSTTEFESSSLFFDVNAEDQGTGYLDLGVTALSPDEDLLAYSVDLAGDEVFELRFRDLRTGEDLPDRVARSYYGGAWSADSRDYYYTVHDEAYRPHLLFRHRMGTDAADDVLVLAEPDPRFELDLRATRSGDVVLISSESRSTSEVWVLDAHDAQASPRSVGGRRHGVMYDVEHVRGPEGGRLLVVTNDGAVEFRLMTAPVPGEGGQDHTSWTEARPEHPDERLLRAEAFAGAVVLSYRADGQHRLRIVGHDDLAGDGVVVASDAVVGCLDLATNELYDAAAVTVSDSTYLRPTVWSSVDLASGAATEVHRGEAPGHDPGAYVLERRSFPAPDGTAVPTVLVRHGDTPLDGSAPALVYAYGAYESVDEPEWDPGLPSLLDRGVVYVHALIRGGGEGGRRWWLDGSMATKQHTFDDLAAVADGLAREGVVDGERIATRGLSAGGLLQGAVFSQRPDRWRAVVAEVPFVDVVTTMFDADTPLTVNEWEEWGDPRIREQFDWLLAYSPYDNLPPAGTRPDLLVTGAVHDPRVMVREPAKWVAALRHSDPQWSPRLVFRCETSAGAHVGPSGRIGHLAYEAEVYAWILDRLGVEA